MLTAIWLFENHSVLLAKEHYFSAMLNNSAVGDETFQYHSPDITSEARAAQSYTHDQVFLKSELEKCRYYLLLYDSVMLALTPNERWLVHQRFDNGLTSSEIIELPESPNIAKSSSSISRHMKHIISKSEQLLMGLGIQTDELL